MESSKPTQSGGDWNVRGRDAETALVGPITATIIDADRRVRAEWSNGFPNWAMYRAAYCGDAMYRRQVRDWCVAYAIAYCEAGGVRKGLPADEIGCLAGWDAFYALLNHKWLIAGMDVADVAGVDPKTYRKVRSHVYAALRYSLAEYWMLLQIHYLRTIRDERWVPSAEPAGKWSHGRGFGEVDHTRTGCFRANPLASSGGGGVYSDDLKEIGV